MNEKRFSAVSVDAISAQIKQNKSKNTLISDNSVWKQFKVYNNCVFHVQTSMQFNLKFFCFVKSYIIVTGL
jgi:lipase chaperone LimK